MKAYRLRPLFRAACSVQGSGEPGAGGWDVARIVCSRIKTRAPEPKKLSPGNTYWR